MACPRDVPPVIADQQDDHHEGSWTRQRPMTSGCNSSFAGMPEGPRGAAKERSQGPRERSGSGRTSG